MIADDLSAIECSRASSQHTRSAFALRMLEVVAVKAVLSRIDRHHRCGKLSRR